MSWLKRLWFFQRKREAASEDEEEAVKPTRPLAPQEAQPVSPQEVSETPKAWAVYPPQLRVGVAQSAGRLRPNNEDALFTWTFASAGSHQAFWGGLFIVADGMGGHSHGELASQHAVYTFARALMQSFFLPWLEDWQQPPPEALPTLESALEKANRMVQATALGGGTTLTAALLWGERLVIIHVGDSRAYYLSPQGTFELLTMDHTVVARLVTQGDLTEEEAAYHPHRNMLYQALGQREPLNPDIHTRTFPPGSVLLLCSDGLWDELPESRIADILKAHRGDPIQAAHILVSEAEQAGGHDNITAVVIQRVPSYTSVLA